MPARQRRLGRRSPPARRSPRRPARAPPRPSPAHRAPAAIEPSSASSPAIASRASASQSQLPGGGQQRRRDRQVEPGPGLAQARRREVGDDPPQRELEAAVGERRAHPLARLAHRRVGQADDREGRQAAVDVDLDPDRPGRDAVEGECPRGGEHAPTLRGPGRPRGAQGVKSSCRSCAESRTAARLARSHAARHGAPASLWRPRDRGATEARPRGRGSGRRAPGRRRLGDRRAQRPHPPRRDRHRRPRRPRPRLRRGQGRPRGLRLGPERPVARGRPRKQRRIRRLASRLDGERPRRCPATRRSASTRSASPSIRRHAPSSRAAASTPDASTLDASDRGRRAPVRRARAGV